MPQVAGLKVRTAGGGRGVLAGVRRRPHQGIQYGHARYGWLAAEPSAAADRGRITPLSRYNVLPRPRRLSGLFGEEGLMDAGDEIRGVIG